MSCLLCIGTKHDVLIQVEQINSTTHVHFIFLQLFYCFKSRQKLRSLFFTVDAKDTFNDRNIVFTIRVMTQNVVGEFYMFANIQQMFFEFELLKCVKNFMYYFYINRYICLYSTIHRK